MNNIEKNILALANKYWLPEFEELEGISNPRFEVKGDYDEYRNLKLYAEVELPGDPRDPTEDELDKQVEKWQEAREKVRAKAREIEERFNEDVIIYSFVDRERE